MSNASPEQRPDAQGFDEVKITTMPRYKTSGLSGDEWRISGLCQLLRKGKVVHEFSMSNVENCCKALTGEIMKASDEGKFYYVSEGDFCDQEGCSDKATVFYKLRHDYCNKGEKHDIKYGDRTRQFCSRHSTRGDCGLQDADENYDVLTGSAKFPLEQDVRPAIFGGTVKVDNIEDAPELVAQRIKEIRQELA